MRLRLPAKSSYRMKRFWSRSTRPLVRSLAWSTSRPIGLFNGVRLWAFRFGCSHPIPNRRANFVYGQKQKASSVEKISANQVRLQWKDLVSEHGGVLALTFTATVTLKDGALIFDSTLDNKSPFTVETIDYPYFGDLNPPTPNSTVAARTFWYGNLGNDEIYPNFGNEKGYWGVNFPIKTFGSHRSLFCLIQAETEGLYLEMSDPSLPYYLEYTFEQHPGVVHGSVVPKSDEFSGWPVHQEFRTCHFIFAQPNSTKKLAPIVMRGYKGDWHAGIDVYKEWRNTWFKHLIFPHGRATSTRGQCCA